MKAAWIIPFIIIGGVLQSCGAAMNGQLNKYVVNPWLASAISFALITLFFVGASIIHPTPLPTGQQLGAMPWWAVIGGLVGAVQVYAGLITSLAIDHFGWFRMQPHPLNAGRIIGGILLISGISLVAKF